VKFNRAIEIYSARSFHVVTKIWDMSKNEIINRNANIIERKL